MLCTTVPQKGQEGDGCFSLELVASFGNRSKPLKVWEKTETCAVSAPRAHGPENVAIMRIPVPRSGSASHAFFSSHRSRMMLGPSTCTEARSVCPTKNSQPVHRKASHIERMLKPHVSHRVFP